MGGTFDLFDNFDIPNLFWWFWRLRKIVEFTVHLFILYQFVVDNDSKSGFVKTGGFSKYGGGSVRLRFLLRRRKFPAASRWRNISNG